jgi:hypothetical protein
MTRRAGADVDWDREWRGAWKAHRANPWFAYQADVYAAWSEWRVQRTPANGSNVLKTDAFDEASPSRRHVADRLASRRR